MTLDLDALRAELDAFAQPAKERKLSDRDARILAGFEEIQRFVAEHGRLPAHGADADVFERLYALRLERLRGLDGAVELLQPLDHQGLLAQAVESSSPHELDTDALLAALTDTGGAPDLRELRHVRSTAQKRAAEDIANREPCEDFDRFRGLFEQVAAELKSGVRQARRFGSNATIEVGHWFILDGLTAYVAGMGEEFDSPQGKKDARLRVVFSNATESNLLRLSLVRALYKDESSRRITDPDPGPLFGSELQAGDTGTGTIYVLRSHSDHPFVAGHREVIHKIGVTGGSVETRIANAAHDATYLLAEVEVVATWQLAGIHRHKLEALLHRLFAPARLDLTINDRFGHPVQPREWFLLPLGVIDEAVRRIQDGSITRFRYDPEQARLVET